MPDGSIMPRAAITHFIPMPGRGAGSVAVVYPKSLGITLGGRCAPRHVRRGWSGVPCYARVLGTLPKFLIFIAIYTLPINYNALRRSRRDVCARTVSKSTALWRHHYSGQPHSPPAPHRRSAKSLSSIMVRQMMEAPERRNSY